MPWCEECAKYWTPNSMQEDGRCPKCGADLADQVSPTAKLSGSDASANPASGVDESTPWHFKLMVVLVVAYLGWRFIDLFI